MIILNHIERGINRLPPRLRSDKGYTTMLLPILRECQKFEEALEEVEDAYSLLHSRSPLTTLKQIGARFGFRFAPNYTREDYLFLLPAAIVASMSSGTWPQVQLVADLLRPSYAVPRAKVFRYPPDAFIVGIPGLEDKYIPDAITILRRAKRSQDYLEIYIVVDGLFTFDIGPGFDEGKLAKLVYP